MSKKFNYVVRHVFVLFYKAALGLQIYEGQGAKRNFAIPRSRYSEVDLYHDFIVGS